MKSSPHNITYCGITEQLEARLSDCQLLAMMLVPMIIAVSILVVTLPFMGKYLLKNQKNIVEKENRNVEEVKVTYLLFRFR